VNRPRVVGQPRPPGFLIYTPAMRTTLLAMAAALAAGCGLPEGDYFGKVPENPDPTHFRFCNSGEPEYVDPALATDTASTPLVYLMFAGLTDWGTDFAGTAVPDLATHWEAAEDYRTFTYHLREGIQWSNGRPITSHDFAYHLQRILHAKTLSRNSTPLDPIKSAKQFTAGRVKMLMADAPPFRQGDIVDVVGIGGQVAENPGDGSIPSSNIRKATRPLRLRDLGRPESEAYATVPPGEEVDIVELGGPDRSWAYVFWLGFDWYYGWVPLAELDLQPSGEVQYTVREIPPERRPGVTLSPDPDFAPRQGVVAGAHLLTIPEVLGIRTPDERTLVIETSVSTPYMDGESQGRIFRPSPRESVSRSPQGWTRPQNGLLVTSGAFIMTNWRVRDRIEFVKSQSYWDADNIRLDRFTSYQINDQAAASNYYAQGGCDAVASNNVPYSYMQALTGARTGKPYKDFQLAPYSGIYYYVLNSEKLDNVHLRRALNFAVDRSPFPHLLHGGEHPTSSFTPGAAIRSLTDEELALCGVSREEPGVATILDGKYCYLPPPGLDFDPVRAKEELALARQQLGKKFPSEISIKFNTGVEQHKLVAEYVHSQLTTNLGIKVRLSSMEWKTYLKETTSGNFEIARLGWIGSTGDPESQFLLVFKCGSLFNRSRWCSEEYMRLFAEAEATTDRTARLAILRRAEKLMLEEAPIIPLYVYTQKHLRKPYVKNFSMNLGDNPPRHRVWIDPDWRASEGKGAE
jgi:oligopeptide transport system substrate-binding protein